MGIQGTGCIVQLLKTLLVAVGVVFAAGIIEISVPITTLVFAFAENTDIVVTATVVSADVEVDTFVVADPHMVPALRLLAR